MAPMQVERTGDQTTARTGWQTTARCCPQHGSALELTFDETDYSTSPSGVRAAFDHDDNRVLWHCATCVGSYTENYFLYRSGFHTPPPRRLILRCPQCGSRRVTHACVPECCNGHACLSCGRGFDARLELVERGHEVTVDGAAADRATDTDADTSHYDVMMSVPGTPACRSRFTRDFRRCPAADHPAALELVFLSILMATATTSADPRVLGWYCAACDHAWTESWFRAQRRGFIPAATPAALCEVCRSSALESEGDDGTHARCTNCGSLFRFHLDETTSGTATAE